MSINIKIGAVYPATDFRSGSGAKGAWAFFKVKAKKGYDQVNVWAANADGLSYAPAFKVEAITNVELKSRLDERTQRWYKDYNVTAKLSPAEAKGEDPAEMTEADIDKMFGII